jgi:hypothetical protein
MRSDAFGEAVAALAAHAGECTENWSTAQRLAQLARIETVARMLPALAHELINQLGAQATRVELGGTLAFAMAQRLRIDRTEAARRIHEAADLGPRRALTGEPLEPKLAATAAAQRDGKIGVQHIQIIRGFLDRLPDAVDFAAREETEHQLAEYATQHGPEQLRKFAVGLALRLNPDGDFSDADRTWRRGVVIGRQGLDGMSRISGLLCPELRAGLNAVITKLGAPGMCNPDDETPTVKGTPSQAAIDADRRSRAQRGALLPMRDVIRLARHAFHYLLIYDGVTSRPLYLGKTKRIASADQRIVLHALDRGCTHPGCDAPGYDCEVHHVDEWAAHDGPTNIDKLTFACRSHHLLISPGGWKTRKRPDGITEWIPPPEHERGQPTTNDSHRPERLLNRDDDAA